MAGKKVEWTANALAMVADIYDYLEEQASDDIASVYIDDLLEFGNNLDEKSEHYSSVNTPYFKKKVIAALSFARPMF